MVVRLCALLMLAILSGPAFAQDAAQADAPTALESLMEAIRAREVATVTIVLAQKPNLNTSKNSFDQSALGLAANIGFVEGVKLLINAGANVNAVDESGMTPLFHCVLAWDIFLGNGVPIKNDPMNERKRTKNVRAAAMLLLKAGAQVNFADPETGETVLHRAASAGHIDLINVLVAAKADIALRDRAGATAFDRLTALAQNIERFQTAAVAGILKTLKPRPPRKLTR